MPRPNCSEEVDVGTIEFGRLGQRVVEGHFDGGSMSSDASVMLLGAVDRKLGLTEAAARCTADPRRDPPIYLHDFLRNSALRHTTMPGNPLATDQADRRRG